MIALILGSIGLAAFVVGVVVLGLWLRRYPTKETAEKTSRVMHFLFFAGLGAPFLVSIFNPGLTHLDELVGLDPLPLRPLFLIAGIVLLVPGLYLMGISNKALRALGSGANAFRLTRRIVEMDIYQQTRNPMSLGYYLEALGIGFISGSTLLTLYVLLGLITPHLIYLKFFEELELQLRFGEEYTRYKARVPFLFPRLPRRQPVTPG